MTGPSSAAPSRPRRAARVTLDDTLAVVGPRVPAALVPAAAWGAVRRAADRLPAALTRAFYLECRLAEPGATVDLIVRVEPPGGAILAGLNPAVRLAPALRRDPAWRRIAALCAEWLAPGSPLNRAVSHLWLEFDLAAGDAAAPRLPAPSLFAGLREGAAAAPGEEDWPALLDALAGPLLAEGLQEDTRRAAYPLLAGRPAGVGVPYLGVMCGRGVPALRLYFRGVPSAGVPAFLRAAAWPGEVDGVAGVMDDLARAGAPEVGMLHLDVAGAPLPAAGIELTCARAPQLRGSLRETAFLERLVELGLCADDARRGLLAWPGASRCELRHELWRSVMARRVNCVKLRCGPGRLQAKGYLLAFHLPAARTRSPPGGG